MTTDSEFLGEIRDIMSKTERDNADLHERLVNDSVRTMKSGLLDAARLGNSTVTLTDYKYSGVPPTLEYMLEVQPPHVRDAIKRLKYALGVDDDAFGIVSGNGRTPRYAIFFIMDSLKVED